MNKNFPPLILTYVLSLILIFNMETWMGVWMILELNTLTFIGLLLMKIKSSSLETAISYFLIQTTSSLIFIVSLYFTLIFSQLASPSLLFLMAMMVKLTASPTHTWAFPIMATTSWSLCWLILTAQKLFPLLLLEIFHPEWQALVIFILISTLLMGSLPNLSSNTLKTMMIFSSISTISWTYAALTVNSSLWKIFLIIYSGTLILMISQSSKKSNKNIMVMTMWLSMAGIPPFVGFFPKLMIITDLAHSAMSLLVLLFLITSVLDTFIYFRLGHTSMLKEKSSSLLSKAPLLSEWKPWLIFNSLLIVLMM